MNPAQQCLQGRKGIHGKKGCKQQYCRMGTLADKDICLLP